MLICRWDGYPPLRINTYKLVRCCLNEVDTTSRSTLDAFVIPIAFLYTTAECDRRPYCRTELNISRTRRIYSMTSSRASSYASLKSSGSNSPPLRLSNDSDDSLRALELTEGPILASSSRRGRSYSISGFDFQHDLLPLSTSLSEPETVHGESTEKNLGLFNGMF